MSDLEQVFTDDHYGDPGPTPHEEAKDEVPKDEVPKDGETLTQEGAEGTEEDGEPPQQPKKKGGFQKRIDRQNAVIEQLRQELETVKNGQKLPEKVKGGEKLDPDNFEDFSDYLEAVAEQKAMQILRKEKDAEENKSKVREETRKREEWIQKVDAGRSKYADLDEVMDSDAPMTPDMSEHILDSPVGVDLVYWLGTHPEEAKRIADLPPKQQVRELLRQEILLAEKPKAVAKQSKAPNPITPIQARTAPATELSPETDFEAWSKKMFG